MTTNTHKAIRHAKRLPGDLCRRKSFVLILAVMFSHGISASGSTQSSEQFVDERLQAQKVVAEFMSRIRKTRDLATLKDLYVPDFISRSLKSNDSSLPDVGSSPTISRPFMAQLSQSDLERYYFAQVNVRYLSILYLATAHSPKEIKLLENDKTDTRSFLFPSEVAVLFDNQLINQEIETPQQLRDVIGLLEKAGAMMRNRFQRNPPEGSAAYLENLGDVDFSDPNLQPRPYLSIESQERSGFPAGTHFFNVITKPQLFELTLVKTGEGMKIIWARVYPYN
jgi:hypothetical protein